MKKAFITVLAVLSVSAVFAQDNNPIATLPGGEVIAPKVKAPSRNSFDLGVVTYEGDYAGVRKAQMSGIQAGFTHKFASGGAFVATGEYATGKSSGPRSTGASLTKTDVTLLGKSAPGMGGFSLGGGANFVDASVENGVTSLMHGVIALERELKLQHWLITPAVQYKFLVGGGHFSGNQLTGAVTKGDVTEVSLAFVQRHGDYRLAVKPFMRTFTYSNGASVDKSTETGLSLNLIF